MKKQISVHAALTLVEIEEKVAHISDLRWTRQQISDDQEALRCDLDNEIAKLKTSFLPPMERHAQTIEDLSVSIDVETEIVAEWARAHQEDHFFKRRSMEFLHATIGFRKARARLELRARHTFERAAYKLSRLPWGKKYLRPAAINKEAILKDRAKFEAKPERLQQIGIVIRQDETFFIDPKEVRSDALQQPQQKVAA